MIKHVERVLRFASVGIGLSLLGFGIVSIADAITTRHWPATTGEIVTSRITATDPEHQEAVVIYRYVVNAKEYRGNTVHVVHRMLQSVLQAEASDRDFERWMRCQRGESCLWGGFSRGAPGSIARSIHWRTVGLRYPPGKVVSVYYDPANPSRARLERGVGVFTVLVTFVGIAGSVVTGWSLLRWLNDGRPVET